MNRMLNDKLTETELNTLSSSGTDSTSASTALGSTKKRTMSDRPATDTDDINAYASKRQRFADPAYKPS